MEYDQDLQQWFPTGGPAHLSILTLAGTLSYSIYLIPVILRFGDFFFNPGKYICGFMSYMVLLPMYTNLMQIYSICNLHDLSWGNRPSESGNGTEALAEDKKKQK